MASGASIATAYVQILPTTQGIGQGIASALGGAAGAMGGAAAGATAASGAFAGMASSALPAAAAVTAVGAGIVSIGKDAVQTGMQFDASMSQVYALMSRMNDGTGLTEAQMTRLNERAREMGSTTQFTASQAAEAMGYMALAGWDVDQIYDGLPSVLNLAAASSMDLGRASDIVTDYMGAFSATAPTATHLVDLLALAQSSSNATTEQFSQAWKYSAGMMNTFGQSADTTTAILAHMADQGHKASTGGVELTAVMTGLYQAMDKNGNIELAGQVINLAQATENFNPAEFAQRVAVLNSELAELEPGTAEYTAKITAFNEELGKAGEFRNIIDVFADMQGVLSGAGFEPGSVGYVTALSGLFQNVRGYRGIAAILNGDTAAMQAFEQELINADGQAETQAGIVNDNLAGDLRLLSSALDELKITLSDTLTPAIREVVQWLTQLVGWINQWGAAGDASGMSVEQMAESIQSLDDTDPEGIGQKIFNLMQLINNDSENPATPDRIAALQQLRDAIANTDMSGDASHIGESIAEGIDAGSGAYNFTGTGNDLRDQIVTAIDQALGVGSPATALIPTGEFAAAGVGLGMQEYDYSADALAASAAIQAALAAALAIADWVTTSAPIGAGIARGIQAKASTVSMAAGLLITTARSRMQSLVGAGGAKFVPIGRDIAAGVAKGIKDNASSVIEALGNLIDDAIKSALAKLGIGSPSRVMAEEVGKPIAQGVGMGIRDNAAVPVTALTDTLDTLTKVTAAEFAGAGSMPARGGFTFNQTVNSPKALTPWEVARQARNAARQMAEAMA